jgi:hypothetical protein
VTEPTRPNDEDLAESIRRSMAHYTFDGGPLPHARAGRLATWRWPALAGAAIAGAAVALMAVALVGWPRPSSLGTGTPSPSPSASAIASPQPTESLAPSPSEVAQASADALCLADPGEIPADWLAPGDTRAGIRDELMALPLLHTDQRDHAAFFVYADQRFVIACVIDRRNDGRSGSSIARGIREDHGDGLEVSTGSAYAGGEVVDGRPRPADMWISGSAAPRFVRVEVVLADGSAVEAWVGDGLWLAWWNEPIDSVKVRGYDREGNVASVTHELKAPLPVNV